MKEKTPTLLQKRVWKEIAQIKKGTVITYKELAQRAGFPKAIRAVATAVGKNPHPVVVPCHRVIHSDGTLGGYSGRGGIKQKRKLLESE
jgi:methylated-DNA-[protein]-cysteine S-methyltransferase